MRRRSLAYLPSPRRGSVRWCQGRHPLAASLQQRNATRGSKAQGTMSFQQELQDDFDAELLAALEREDESEQQEQREDSQPPDDASGPLTGQPKVCTTATDAACTTHAKRRKLCAAEGAAAQETQAHSPQCFTLAMLPEPLLLRVLGFLSPEDMCIVGQTSQVLRAAAKDSSLWRRLYFSRWPKGPKSEEEEEEGLQDAVGWKVLYMERDHRELSESVQAAPALLRPLYQQMATAKRSESLGIAAAATLFRSPWAQQGPAEQRGGSRGGGGGGPSQPGRGRGAGCGGCQELRVAEAVDTFRRQRGLTDSSLHGAHCCGGGECRGFVQVVPGADVWVCATTGYAHRCGENCREREVDPASANLVCPISGRCFDRMMSEDEEEQAGQERGGEEGRGEEEWQADEGISGRLGRAFYAGYNASSEHDLLMQFGVKWS